MGGHTGLPMQNKTMQNKFNPDIHDRKSIRLKDYDYSQKGAYFVTICVNNMVCLFGEVVGGTMVLNDAGNMVHDCMEYFANKAFHNITIDDVRTIMPNHIHGIVADRRGAPRDEIKGEHTGSPLGRENNDVTHTSVSTLI